MNTLKFSVHINAPREKVWETLWNDVTYRQWTSVFHEGSYAVSDWNEGSPIQFLGPNGDGMYSVIEEKIPYQTMVFKHLGEVKDGVEVQSDWGESRERYYLSDAGQFTQLEVELDTVEEFEKYFKEAFPKALDILKQISEA